MFKKKPNVRGILTLHPFAAKSLSQIKPLAPLRSSDRRKIADQIIKDFHVEVPGDVEEQGDKSNEASSALSLGALRNSLMPEDALSARFNTTAGPDLKQVSGTVYAGTHPGGDQRILWFKIEERLIPTGELGIRQSRIKANRVMGSLHTLATSTTRTSPPHARNRLEKAT